jgi:hypothetical protein
MVLPWVIALEFLIFAIERVCENTRRLTGCSALVQYYLREQLGN